MFFLYTEMMSAAISQSSMDSLGTLIFLAAESSAEWLRVRKVEVGEDDSERVDFEGLLALPEPLVVKLYNSSNGTIP